AALDRDLGVDVDPLQPLRRFIIEKSARLINAVGHALDHRAALRLGLVENLRDAMEHRRFAVALEELVDAPQREAAGGDLRAQIAERAFRKADVVANDAIERFVALAGFVELQLVELQPFLPRIDEIAPRAEAGAGAADIDPMRPHHREQHQLALEEIGHIDDDVVEVLPRHGLVVHDEDIAGGEAVLAIDPDAVGDDDAEIGDEMRDAADILAEQLALGVDEGGAEIPYLVDHHIVGGALQIGRHLVGDRRQGVAQHFERDRIQLGAHRPSSPGAARNRHIAPGPAASGSGIESGNATGRFNGGAVVPWPGLPAYP